MKAESFMGVTAGILGLIITQLYFASSSILAFMEPFALSSGSTTGLISNTLLNSGLLIIISILGLWGAIMVDRKKDKYWCGGYMIFAGCFGFVLSGILWILPGILFTLAGLATILYSSSESK